MYSKKKYALKVDFEVAENYLILKVLLVRWDAKMNCLLQKNLTTQTCSDFKWEIYIENFWFQCGEWVGFEDWSMCTFLIYSQLTYHILMRPQLLSCKLWSFIYFCIFSNICNLSFEILFLLILLFYCFWVITIMTYCKKILKYNGYNQHYLFFCSSWYHGCQEYIFLFKENFIKPLELNMSTVTVIMFINFRNTTYVQTMNVKTRHDERFKRLPSLSLFRYK